jgi:endonuclease/exonuclease/phosphatase family metal-dependent hydrolase
MSSTRGSSRLIVLLIVIAMTAAIVASVSLRSRMRCAGFEGPGITAEDLPQSGPKPGNLRIAAWNIRNFPIDERPYNPDLAFARRTNICDLEAVLAGLDADVLAFEEIRDPRRFERILRKSAPDRSYRVVFSASGGGRGQHIAVAWDHDRLRLDGQPVEVVEVALDDPHLRPALAVTLKSREGNLDFTVIAVHLRAMPRGYPERVRQYRALAQWIDEWVAEAGDEDVILLGDLNTTGPEGATEQAELAVADLILGEAGLTRLPNETGCTEYWEGPGDWDGVQIPSLIDHVYVRGLDQLDTSVPLRSWLHCARARCQELDSSPSDPDGTFWDVSDHCPLTFEIRDGE